MLLHLLFLSTVFLLPSPSFEAEKVVLETDKSIYVSGEPIMCSVWCKKGDVLSTESSVAYIELVNSEGIAATSKVPVISGRGAGFLILPLTISTGNYNIFAYTKAANCSTVKRISVFNTVSSDRVRDGVVIKESIEQKIKSNDEVSPGLSYQIKKHKGEIHLRIINTENRDVSLSVSVYEEDGIAPARDNPGDLSLVPQCVEKDGEIIRARVIGLDAKKTKGDSLIIAYLSAAGSPSDFYVGRMEEDDIVCFQTNNVYGNRDLFCEVIGSKGEKLNCTLVPISPFIDVSTGIIPPLQMSQSFTPALISRHNANVRASSDMVYSCMPIRNNILFLQKNGKWWHLDDYTRFGTIEETLIELIPDAKIHKTRGVKSIGLSLPTKSGYSRTENVLVMLDGVPISNHELLLNFDAMLLSDIYLYPNVYAISNHVFNGVISFVTARQDNSTFDFPDMTRIYDYKGCSYPISCRLKSNLGHSGGRTLLWEPIVDISAYGEVEYVIPATGAVLSCRINKG